MLKTVLKWVVPLWVGVAFAGYGLALMRFAEERVSSRVPQRLIEGTVNWMKVPFPKALGIRMTLDVHPLPLILPAEYLVREQSWKDFEELIKPGAHVFMSVTSDSEITMLEFRYGPERKNIVNSLDSSKARSTLYNSIHSRGWLMIGLGAALPILVQLLARTSAWRRYLPPKIGALLATEVKKSV